MSSEADSPSSSLTSRLITRFYSPLALSWLFMALELPIAIAVISRLPDPQVSTAAFLVVMSISMWIESPVIDLLTTSNTLTRDRASYQRIREFVLLLMAGVTLVHALVVFTPLYDWVTGSLLQLRPEVALTARPGLAVMTVWSACIGWRRFRQGVLIRYGETRAVGVGTFVRVAMMALLGFGLPVVTEGPSVVLVAWALLGSVLAEAIFIHFVSISCVKTKLMAEPPAEPLSGASLRRFHFPLTLTTLLNLSAMPVVTAFLSRSNDPVLALAGFQVAQSLVWLHRTIIFALPEALITLMKEAADRPILKAYCMRIGFACSGLQVLFGLIGLEVLFFARVLDAKPELLPLAHTTYLTSALMPVIGAAQSYLRAMLTAIRQTGSRLWATVVSMATLVLGLWIGLRSGLPGVVFAPIALTASLLADWGVLAWFWRRRTVRTFG